MNLPSACSQVKQIAICTFMNKSFLGDVHEQKSFRGEVHEQNKFPWRCSWAKQIFVATFMSKQIFMATFINRTSFQSHIHERVNLLRLYYGQKNLSLSCSVLNNTLIAVCKSSLMCIPCVLYSLANVFVLTERVYSLSRILLPRRRILSLSRDSRLHNECKFRRLSFWVNKYLNSYKPWSFSLMSGIIIILRHVSVQFMT
jgi:hypothetical protein